MTNDPIDKEAGMDLYQLIQDAERREVFASYGIDPTAVETWLQDRAPTHRDPTADEAIYRADRDLAKKRKAKR